MNGGSGKLQKLFNIPALFMGKFKYIQEPEMSKIHISILDSWKMTRLVLNFIL